MAKVKPARILVIPDSHACPYFDLERYTRLGKFASRVKPTHIVSMGDWAEMYSLGKFERGSVKYEGARYENDIAAANEGLDRFTRSYKGKAKKYFLLGNHEARIDRAASEDPAMYGTLSTNDIQAAENGWDVVPFLEYKKINGVKFIHYIPKNGGHGAVSSKYLAQKAVDTVRGSVVIGHSHTFGIAMSPVLGESKTHWGVVSGWFGHPDYRTSTRSFWAVGGREAWTCNVLVLDNTMDGEFSISFIRQEDVK